jgi:hypothetical protein
MKGGIANGRDRYRGTGPLGAVSVRAGFDGAEPITNEQLPRRTATTWFKRRWAK